MTVVGYCPIHPSREIVLVSFAPAPNGRLVRCVLLAIHTGDGVLRRDAREQVASLRPDWMSFAVGLPIDVTPSPTAPIGSAIRVQSVVDQTQEGGRISFHDKNEPRI